MRRMIACAVLLLTPAGAQDSLPEYHPTATSGVIHVLGNYHMGPLLKYWEEGFQKYHPEVRFEEKLLGTANAIAGLYLETADIALMGREIIPMESIGYRRVFRVDPVEMAVATASFNVPL